MWPGSRLLSEYHVDLLIKQFGHPWSRFKHKIYRTVTKHSEKGPKQTFWTGVRFTDWLMQLDAGNK